MGKYDYLVVATKNELRLPAAKEAKAKGYKPIVAGVGGANIIAALHLLPSWASVINVGYAGSPTLPVGTAVRVERTRLWHPGVEYQEKEYQLQDGDGESLCLTAGDFVTDGQGMPRDCMVDMELAYIAAFDFFEVKAVKYISDNLDYEQYGSNQGQ